MVRRMERDSRIAREFTAQVGEWLKPTDCKSVPPSEVRRFESFPVHHDLSRLAGMREVGARCRNPELVWRGIWESRESLVHCVGLLRSAGSAGVDYPHRSEVSGGT